MVVAENLFKFFDKVKEPGKAIRLKSNKYRYSDELYLNISFRIISELFLKHSKHNSYIYQLTTMRGGVGM